MLLKVDTLNNQAYDILKEKILKKELAPGTRLVDSQLAEEFGISRTPLRDAIRKLEEEGLVVSTAGKKGYYVYQPSAKDINEIFELRLMLDIEAVTKVIKEVLPQNPESLELVKDVYYAEITPGQFVSRDEDFHDTLIRLCGNSRLIAIYTDLRNQTRAFRSATSRDQNRIEKAHSFHERIFNGICNRDLEAALKAVRLHVEYSRIDALTDYETTTEVVES